MKKQGTLSKTNHLNNFNFPFGKKRPHSTLVFRVVLLGSKPGIIHIFLNRFLFPSFFYGYFSADYSSPVSLCPPLRGLFFHRRGSKSSLEIASSEGLSTDKACKVIISNATIFQERGTVFFVK